MMSTTEELRAYLGRLLGWKRPARSTTRSAPSSLRKNTRPSCCSAATAISSPLPTASTAAHPAPARRSWSAILVEATRLHRCAPLRTMSLVAFLAEVAVRDVRSSPILGRQTCQVRSSRRCDEV